MTLSILSANVTNPRYFVDTSGNPVFLTGSQNWLNLQDWAAQNVFDYEAYLDILKDHGHNYMRMWTNDSHLVQVNGVGSPFYAITPVPFNRTGPGNAYDGGLKFDLSSFNQSYFDQLRARCIAARDRGIYVGVMLFEAWWMGESDYWVRHYFNGSNNINGTGTTLLDVYTMTDSALVALMDAFVEKVIDTVNDLDNVIYEVCNEAYAASLAWQTHVVDIIHAYEATLDYQHLVGMTALYDEADPEGWNDELYYADWVSPMAYVSYQDDMPIAPATKPSILDDDHVNAGMKPADWFWKGFCRGHNPIQLNYWWDDSDLRENSCTAMGRIRDFASRMDLLNSTPTDNAADCSTEYLLKQAGIEYLAYQPGTGAFTLTVGAATYNREWMNPATGEVAKDSVAYSAGSETMTPPFSGPAVLYLWVGTAPTNEFTYSSPLTIDNAKVPADLTSFSVMISITDNRLKSVIYGGHVASDRGYDIVFSSSVDGNNQPSGLLDFEIEHYNSSTGELIANVEMTIDHDADTLIYIGYGNSSITSLQKLPSSAWDSNHKLVMNMGGAGVLRDSSGVNSTFSSVGAMPKENGGVTLDGTSDYIQTPYGSALTKDSAFTLEAVVYPTSLTATRGIIENSIGAAPYDGIWFLFTSEKVYFGITTNTDTVYTQIDDALSANNWYHIVATYTGSGASSGMIIYINGTVVAQTKSGTTTGTFTGRNFRIGSDCHTTPVDYFHGVIKRVRVHNIARSPDWITTQYNNWSDPAGFVSLGAEVGGTAPSITSESGSGSVTSGSGSGSMTSQ